MRTLSSAVLLLMIPVLSAWATEEVEPLDVYFFARTVGEPLSNSERKILEIEIWRKKLEADQAQKGDVLRSLSKKKMYGSPNSNPSPELGADKENHTSWERYYQVSDCSSSLRNDWYSGI